MTKLQTRREYLVGLGLAKEGRGKFSNAAKEALAKADAEGYQFLDGPSPTGPRTATTLSTVRSEPSSTPVKPVAYKPGDSEYLLPSDFRFPEGEYDAYCRKEGKKVKVGMREVCNNCRVSLVNHSCNAPVIHGDVSVTIEAK